MKKITAPSLRQAIRHALATYALWIPVSFILIAFMALVTTPYSLVIMELIEEMGRRGMIPYAHLLVEILDFLILSVLFICAQWMTILLSLRYPWPIQSNQPIYFAALSAGNYALLLIFFNVVFYASETRNILAMFVKPIYLISPWMNIIYIFVFTFLILRHNNQAALYPRVRG